MVPSGSGLRFGTVSVAWPAGMECCSLRRRAHFVRASVFRLPPSVMLRRCATSEATMDFCRAHWSTPRGGGRTTYRVGGGEDGWNGIQWIQPSPRGRREGVYIDSPQLSGSPTRSDLSIHGAIGKYYGWKRGWGWGKWIVSRAQADRPVARAASATELPIVVRAPSQL